MKNKFFAVILCVVCLFLPVSCSHVEEQPGETTDQVTSADENNEFVSPVYTALSDKEKQLYDIVVDAVVNFKGSADFDEMVTRDEIRKIYRLVYAQERKYFWLSSLFYAPESEMMSLHLNYLYEKDDAELKRAELDSVASAIVGELPKGASDFEKAVYFHDRIVTGCSFSQSEEHVNSAYGVLVKGYGQCEGYAAAMSLLCDMADIPNFTVCGTNDKGETHAWNKILINGSWYVVDCTWDDPMLKRDDPDFVRHDYCLVMDSEINGITHFPDELYKNVPVADSQEFNYFYGKELVYDSVSDAYDVMYEQIKAAGLSGKREAELRFSSEDVYYAALARFFDSGEIKKMIEEINGNFGTKIRSAYKHNNDELYIIHVSLIYESDEE